MADKDLELEALREQIVEKERDITGRDQTIAVRDAEIRDLNDEIQCLNGVINQNGLQAGDLMSQMSDL